MRKPARPFRKTVTRFHTPDGERCTATTPGAVKSTVQTETYYAHITLATGRREAISLGTKDEDEAVVRLRDRIISERQRAAGIVTPHVEAAERPLAEHLAEMRVELLHRGVTAKQVNTVVNNVTRLADIAGWRRVTDIRAGSCAASLARLGEVWDAKHHRHGHAGRSAQTRNHYLKHVRQFVAWLVDDDRLLKDPLRRLKPTRVEGTERHARRVPDDDEIDRLFEYLYKPVASTRDGMSGACRALAYKVSMSTGFRANEMRTLTRASFDLDGGTVTCRAAYDKRKRTATQRLPPWLVDELRTWFASGGGCWERMPPAAGPRMLALDLEAAGIPYRTEGPDGPLYFDFHSLRKYYVSCLANQPGISPKTLMTLARHSTPALSLKVYSEAREGDLQAAVDAVPNPSARKDAK